MFECLNTPIRSGVNVDDNDIRSVGLCSTSIAEKMIKKMRKKTWASVITRREMKGKLIAYSIEIVEWFSVWVLDEL